MLNCQLYISNTFSCDHDSRRSNYIKEQRSTRSLEPFTCQHIPQVIPSRLADNSTRCIYQWSELGRFGAYASKMGDFCKRLFYCCGGECRSWRNDRCLRLTNICANRSRQSRLRQCPRRLRTRSSGGSAELFGKRNTPLPPRSCLKQAIEYMADQMYMLTIRLHREEKRTSFPANHSMPSAHLSTVRT